MPKPKLRFRLRHVGHPVRIIKNIIFAIFTAACVSKVVRARGVKNIRPSEGAHRYLGVTY